MIPAPGVRVEKISNLDKNIALGMRAQSVRILAPIPGKAAVGVEVPNKHPTAVGMREILESQDWHSHKAELPIALGKDVSGKPLVSDLAKMPHLLIAEPRVQVSRYVSTPSSLRSSIPRRPTRFA